MENTKQPKISTPVAIIVAGVLVMIGILLTNGGGAKVAKQKTLSEQVGVSKDKLTECVKGIDTTALSTKIQNSVASAMKSVPENERGTPYSVIVGSNGVKAEIRGADSYENIKKLIDQVSAGTVTQKYTGEIAVTEEGDHIMGNANAPIKIIEYSDYECPYCKMIHSSFEKIVSESNGNVSWVYRHWPIHQNSFEKLVAAECVAKIKGNDAFWEYSKLLFGLLQTEQKPSVSDQL
ncbi:MAG TPA: thioredoxin domain-containing protein [Candidatus Paceibacterota bacterium]|nr:thioredoxin domain-containing protein [Candidatus Paceibacterota bacterium]